MASPTNTDRRNCTAAGRGAIGGAPRLSRSGRLLLAAGVPAITVLESGAQLPLWGADTVLAAVNLATVVTFLITGILLREDSGQRGTSWAVILAGVTRPLGWLNHWGTGPWPLYASVFGYLDDIFGAWALLRYPNPRLQRHHRYFVASMCGWLVGVPAFLAVVSRPAWHGFSAASWWPAWFPDRLFYADASAVFDAGAVGLAMMFIGLLLSRYFKARGIDRLILTPVIVAAIVAAIAAATVMAGLLFASVSDDLLTIEGATELVVPLAFLISVIQRNMARAGVADLAVRLSGPAPAEAVRDELRRVLRDPRLDLYYWMPGGQNYVDTAGRPVDLPDTGNGRLVIRVSGSGQSPLAAILAHPSARRDRVLLDGALGASRMALENERLQADLRARLEEATASRARIAEAALAERRRLERNLHDGAQQRLIGLAATLAATRAEVTDPAVISALDHASTELLEALRELRDLARGILPAILSQSGVGPAVEGVVERIPIHVRLDITATRYRAAVEATAYFVICEALANAVRHARAPRAEVRVGEEDRMLVVHVTDNGRGGADPRGAGLAALADRVKALGGEITIDSPAGGGTQLTARIPCA